MLDYGHYSQSLELVVDVLNLASVLPRMKKDYTGMTLGLGLVWDSYFVASSKLGVSERV